MSTRRTLIDWILTMKGSIAPRELARHANITRQAASKQLARMVRTGELYRKGVGNGARYLRAQLDPLHRNPYGPQLVDFWLRLESKVTATTRVKLAEFPESLRLRQQVYEVMARTREYEFVFVDFAGVEDVGDAFLEELVIGWPQEAFWMPILINANDQLARRIRALQARPPPPVPPDDDPLCSS